MNTKEELLNQSNREANRFNIYALLVVMSLAVLIEILNELEIFLIPKLTMRPTIVAIVILFSIPYLIYLFHDKVFKKNPSILEWKYFKVVIIVVSYVALTLTAIILSFHAALLLAVPPIMAAQYRNSRKAFIIVLIVTIIFVPLVIYGSYFFGYVDLNLVKIETHDEIDKWVVVADRINNTENIPKRMFELFYHHVLPRWISIVFIDILVVGINGRSSKMIDSQFELTEQVNHEMERRSKMQNRVIEDLAAVIETRDVGTGEHVIRTKKYVGMIAREMQKYPKYKDILTDEVIYQIENSAPLHDVGKIAVRDAVLLKPGKLTDEEFEEMKVHSAKGGEMINNIFSNMDDEQFFKTAYDIAVAHHEKWNGTGYPNGLKGEEIPLSARIMAIADVYDALTSKRVYKDSMPPEKAFDIIVEGRGTHFDPDIIDIVVTIKNEFISYVNEKKTEGKEII